MVVANVFHARGHHSHDGERLCVQRDFLAENIGIGCEAALPQAIAKDDLARICGQFILGIKLPAKQGTQSEQVEETSGNSQRRKTLRLVQARELQVSADEAGQSFEGMVAGAIIEKIKRIDAKLWIVGIAGKNPEQAAGLVIGQRLQQDTGDDAEDGAVGADAQGEGQHHHYGEGGIIDQRPACIAQVLKEVVNIVGAAHVAAFLLDLRNIS